MHVQPDAAAVVVPTAAAAAAAARDPCAVVAAAAAVVGSDATGRMAEDGDAGQRAKEPRAGAAQPHPSQRLTVNAVCDHARGHSVT